MQVVDLAAVEIGEPRVQSGNRRGRRGDHLLKLKFARLKPQQFVLERESRDTVLDGLDDVFEFAVGFLEIADEAIPVNIAVGGDRDKVNTNASPLKIHDNGESLSFR
jgi:hypothetical protein